MYSSFQLLIHLLWWRVLFREGKHGENPPKNDNLFASEESTMTSWLFHLIVSFPTQPNRGHPFLTVASRNEQQCTSWRCFLPPRPGFREWLEYHRGVCLPRINTRSPPGRFESGALCTVNYGEPPWKILDHLLRCQNNPVKIRTAQFFIGKICYPSSYGVKKKKFLTQISWLERIHSSFLLEDEIPTK